MTFSVVVPTHDRPQALARCLESLARLDYPRERFEVLVVNDGGAEPPRSHSSVRWLAQPRGGPARARNLGAREARGEVLAFLDDDCLADPGWLSALERQLARTPGALVGGTVRNALAENPYAAASQLIVEVARDWFPPGRPLAFFATNNLAVPREAFLRLGGFDPEFRTSEDRELCDRWTAAGGTCAVAPDAVVHHAHPLTLRTFLAQHFAYGRGAFRFHRKRRSTRGEPFRAEAGFYAEVFRRAGPRLAGLMVLWQVANLAGFLWEALAARR